MSARRQESLVRAPKSPVKLGYFCGKPYQDEVQIFHNFSVETNSLSLRSLRGLLMKCLF